MTLTEKLQGIRKRADAATTGPWRAGGDAGWPIGSFSTGNSGDDGKDYTVWTAPMSGSELGESDAKTDALFIAASRSDIPFLLEALEEALGALDYYANAASSTWDNSVVPPQLRPSLGYGSYTAIRSLAKIAEMAKGTP